MKPRLSIVTLGVRDFSYLKIQRVPNIGQNYFNETAFIPLASFKSRKIAKYSVNGIDISLY